MGNGGVSVGLEGMRIELKRKGERGRETSLMVVVIIYGVDVRGSDW